MKLALLGVGNAGVRLVDRLHGAETHTETPISEGNVLAINTTPTAFAEVEHIDERRQLLIGDTHPEVYQPDELAEDSPTSVDREGVAGDPELGAAVAREELPEIRRALDSIDDTEVDAALVVTGLGGGTGCGVGSVLLEELASIYEIPLYVLGVLPSADESDRRAWSAARAIRTFVPIADAVLPVDNESWHTDETYEAVNEAVVTRLISLFGTGEHASKPFSEMQMDPNDISRTLEVGGLSTIGYVQTELSVESGGRLDTLRRLLGFGADSPEPQTDATTIKKLVERALGSKLTLPCDISTADRVLLILSGPPRELSRKGFETGRSLLEDETGTVEILAGDEPDSEATAVTATVLLSNVTGVPRVEQLQRRAVAFQSEQTEQPNQPATEQSTTEADTADRQATEKASEESTVDDDHKVDEADTEIDPATDAEPDRSDAAANEHGFRFADDESVDPEELISEAEPTPDGAADESDSSTDDKTAAEATDGATETPADTNATADEPTGTDSVADDPTDEPSQ